MLPVCPEQIFQELWAEGTSLPSPSPKPRIAGSGATLSRTAEGIGSRVCEGKGTWLWKNDCNSQRWGQRNLDKDCGAWETWLAGIPGGLSEGTRGTKQEEGGWPTRNRATAVPRMKPAITSEQWFRYSETRLRPVRKAVQRVPRHSTGLASRLLLVLIVLVMYIWNRPETGVWPGSLCTRGMYPRARTHTSTRKHQRKNDEQMYMGHGASFSGGPGNRSDKDTSDCIMIGFKICSFYATN